MIYAAVFIDLFSDGLMIGVGSTLRSPSRSCSPSGRSRRTGRRGSPRSLNSATRVSAARNGWPCPLPSLLQTSWGNSRLLLLRDQSKAAQLTALAFTAGLLIVAGVEEMPGESHEAAEDTRTSAGFFVGGFALFTLVASYFESAVG